MIKIVWENDEGTHTDEFRVGYYFPQVPEDEGGQGGNEGDQEEVSFDEWWANAPKVPMERIDLSYFDYFKTNGTVETTYTDGVLEITINNSNADDWADAYNATSMPTFGESQEYYKYFIGFWGKEDAASYSLAKIGNATGTVMKFENDENKFFIDDSYI